MIGFWIDQVIVVCAAVTGGSIGAVMQFGFGLS